MPFMPFAPIQVDSCIRYIIEISVYNRDRLCDRLRLCLCDLNKHH